jgi:hypothetical protein
LEKGLGLRDYPRLSRWVLNATEVSLGKDIPYTQSYVKTQAVIRETLRLYQVVEHLPSKHEVLSSNPNTTLSP